MERLEFDWDDANVKHLARLRVLPREAEHVVLHEAIDLGTEIVDERNATRAWEQPRRAACRWW